MIQKKNRYFAIKKSISWYKKIDFYIKKSMQFFDIKSSFLILKNQFLDIKKWDWILVHLSRRLKCTIVIYTLSVVRLWSVPHPSSLTFHIFDFSSETTEWNSTNLTGSKISMSSTKFVFFGPIGKTRWPPWPPIGWDIFDFSSEPLNGIQRNFTGSKIQT